MGANPGFAKSPDIALSGKWTYTQPAGLCSLFFPAAEGGRGDALRGRCGADSGMHTRVRAAVSGLRKEHCQAAAQYMYIPGCSLNVELHMYFEHGEDEM